MTSSIFGQGPVSSAVSMAKQMANGNPQALFNRMLSTNPQFKAFVDANKGKSPQQIAQENGIDLSQIAKML